MSQRTLDIVIYREGDVFVAQCLNVDIASDGATAAQARENLREALELYFDDAEMAPDVQFVAEPQLEQLTLKSA